MAALKYQYSEFDHDELLKPADRIPKENEVIQPPRLMKMVE
jgi:hypothetical protein